MSWSVQNAQEIIGTTATPATLTSAFSGNQITREVKAYDKVTAYISYTPAEDTAECEIQFEIGPNQATFYPVSTTIDINTTGERLTSNDIVVLRSGGASTVVKARIEMDVNDFYMRVSAKETVTGTAGTILVTLMRSHSTR